MMMSQAMIVYAKDVAIERRSRELLFTMVSFSLLVTLVFALSFFIDSDTARSYAPGVLWVVVLFGGTLGLQRLFETERENNCLAGLLLSPIDPRSIYVGKSLFLLSFLLMMELVTVPLAFLFFDLFEFVNVTQLFAITLTLLLGSVGFVLVGTLFAASLMNMRLREVMLPVVVYPLVTPVLIAGVQATRALLSDATLADVSGWLMFLGAFDLIYLGLCLWLFPALVRE